MRDGLLVLNKYNTNVNILHFQGKNLEELRRTARLTFDCSVLKPLEDNLSIMACWTDYEKCILGQELEKFDIPIINALPNDYDYNSQWDMRNKIKFYIDCLENTIKDDIVLVLDAYDVIIVSTENIVKKFKEQPYRILFNTSANNFPPVHIDDIENRYSYDYFAPFLNAGCCIGYKDDLIKFYKECYELINIPNEFNSEQFVVRHAFAKYSIDPNQKFVWLDFKRNIFNTMAYMQCDFDADTFTLHVTDNLLVPKNKRLINR